MLKALLFLPFIALLLAWPFPSGWSTSDPASTPLQTTLDFGDAWETPQWGAYPVKLIDDGARHVIGGPWLGDGTDAPDAEADGQPDNAATGDDTDAEGDDEDGVVIPTLYIGYPGNIDLEVNSASGSGGVVEAWIDFGNDLDWTHPGEQIFAGHLPDGIHTIPVTPPLLSTTGRRATRFRISSVGGLAPTGEASDGEVEDYEMWIEDPAWDFGDAPDSDLAVLYPTRLIQNGARHLIRGPWLGDINDAPDADADGQPDGNALGDDNNGNDDENGVTIPQLEPGTTVNMTVEVSGGGGYVEGWIDFDANFSWQHPAEQVVSGYYADGIHAITVNVPNGAEPSQTFARFRISRSGGLTPEGEAFDGEVEDYEATIKDKWEQLPDLDSTSIAVSYGSPTISYLEYPADDFECRQPGYISEIQFWIGVEFDLPATGLIMEAKIYSNLTADMSPGGFAQPDSLLWHEQFVGKGVEFFTTMWDDDIVEGWYKNGFFDFPADTSCRLVTIPIPPDERFFQTGTSGNPKVYWLRLRTTNGVVSEQGWKASSAHWNAGAVRNDNWGTDEWEPLDYPTGHPYVGQPMDMAFRIVSTPVTARDYGDAPWSPDVGGYPTLKAQNGAAHEIGGPWLGDETDNPDPDPDGQPHARAQGDDNVDRDDEDGVLIPELFAGFSATIRIDVVGGGRVQGWIDFDTSRTWDGSEMVVNQLLAAGNHELAIDVPGAAAIGQTYARFRISTAGGLDPTGNANDGEVEDYEVTVSEAGIGVGEDALPKRFGLYQCVPNPFNPSTVICYDVPAGGGNVTLQIFDVSGRLVTTLVDGVQTAGTKEVLWEGADRRGRRVATGVYFYRMVAGDFVQTRKMVLMK
jgi:hypothetical protein